MDVSASVVQPARVRVEMTTSEVSAVIFLMPSSYSCVDCLFWVISEVNLGVSWEPFRPANYKGFLLEKGGLCSILD